MLYNYRNKEKGTKREFFLYPRKNILTCKSKSDIYFCRSKPETLVKKKKFNFCGLITDNF